MTIATPAVRPVCAAFFVRPLRQAPRLEPSKPHRRLSRPLASLEARQGQAQARHRSYPRSSGSAGRLSRSASCRRPTPARSRWRCGRCSGRARVDVLAWESFGEGWVTDVVKQLKLQDVTHARSRLWRIARSRAGRSGNDVVFTWNGTTSGVRVPNADWIAADRAGLTICDATSAAFAQPLDWPKLDVVTFSWQKVLGGEAAHGMLDPRRRAPSRGSKATRRPGRCRRSSA